jgi:GTP-binding protein Era
MTQPASQSFRCGYIAIAGRPNVGKSTLLNAILGHKLSITSRRPQTTRHQILGIKTQADYQAIYVDTPGLHSAGKKAINRYMNRAASNALKAVDLVIFMLSGCRWTAEDERIWQQLSQLNCSLIVVLNKIDRLADKAQLLPQLKYLDEKTRALAIIPLSAKTGHNVTELETTVSRHLPLGECLFPDQQMTDKSSGFMAAEYIREKIMRQLGDELPYQATVTIEQFKEQGGKLAIDALILVERPNQKAIIIGKGGARLKAIGSAARLDLEALFNKPVMLRLWVKVKTGWSDNERLMKSLGYEP